MELNRLKGLEYMQDMMFGFYNAVNDGISKVLDKIVFIDESILRDGVTHKIFGNYSSFGTIKIAYTLIYGVLIYFLITYLLSKITSEDKQNFSQFMYKILIGAIIISFSFEICQFILDLNNSITEEILNFGNKILKVDVSFENLFEKIKLIIGKKGNEDVNTINSILEAFVSFGLINLILVYSLRYIYIKILCILMPFAIILKANEKTEYITKAWAKSFFGLLFLQHIIAIIIIMAVSIRFGTVSVFSKILCVGCVYALMQVNELQRELFGGSSLYINNTFRSYKGGI